MSEKPGKSDSCVVDEGTVKAVELLLKSGYSYLDIAYLLNLSRTQVFKIVNKKYKIKKYKRCKKCGWLIKGDYCIGCKLKEEVKAEPAECKENGEIKLELKPQDYKRYLKVKKKKVEEIDKKAKEKLDWLNRKRN